MRMRQVCMTNTQAMNYHFKTYSSSISRPTDGALALRRMHVQLAGTSGWGQRHPRRLVWQPMYWFNTPGATCTGSSWAALLNATAVQQSTVPLLDSEVCHAVRVENHSHKRRWATSPAFKSLNVTEWQTGGQRGIVWNWGSELQWRAATEFRFNKASQPSGKYAYHTTKQCCFLTS